MEAAVPSPFEVGHLLKFKLSKNISEKDLCSPHTVFGQDLFNRSLSKISAYKDLAKNVEISFVPQMKDLSSIITTLWQDTPFVTVSVEAAVPSPFVGWLSSQSVYNKSPGKIFVRDLKVSSLLNHS